MATVVVGRVAAVAAAAVKEAEGSVMAAAAVMEPEVVD